MRGLVVQIEIVVRRCQQELTTTETSLAPRSNATSVSKKTHLPVGHATYILVMTIEGALEKWHIAGVNEGFGFGGSS